MQVGIRHLFNISRHSPQNLKTNVNLTYYINMQIFHSPESQMVRILVRSLWYAVTYLRFI